MLVATTFVLLLIACAAFAQIVPFPSGNHTCGRRYQVYTPNPFDFGFIGVAGCLNQSIGALEFAVSSRRGPFFQMSAFAARDVTNTTVNGPAIGGGATLIFDTVVEFEEANNVPGFQPGQDIEHARYFLGSSFNGTKWTALQKSSTDLGDNQTLHTISYSSRDGQFNNSFAMDFSLDITPVRARFGRQILTPSSFKLSVNMNNITYTNPNSTGIALGALLVTRGAIVRRNASLFNATQNDPADPQSGNFDVTDLEDQNGRPFGFFSWNNTVTVGDQLVNVSTSAWSIDANANVSDFPVPANYTIRRIFFAIDGRVDSWAWDPSLGAIEEDNPNSGSSAMSSEIESMSSADMSTGAFSLSSQVDSSSEQGSTSENNNAGCLIISMFLLLALFL